MTNHTPETWHINNYGDIKANDADRCIPVTGVSIPMAGPRQEEAEANSRRIVACVNACAGVSNEALDGGWEAAGLSAYAHRLEVDLASVTAQRDELLTAMKIVTTGTVGDILDSLHEFHSLVAKCEVK